jgi:hypothetical protein
MSKVFKSAYYDNETINSSAKNNTSKVFKSAYYDNETMNTDIRMKNSNTKIKLPIDKDGEFINLDDIVYDKDGVCYTVMGIGSERIWVSVNASYGLSIRFNPSDLSHNSPLTDSWEAIIDDALEWEYGEGKNYEKIHRSFVLRCKKLAERGYGSPHESTSVE